MMTVRLTNYGESECDCQCGCGMKTSEQCMIAHQAFLMILSRRMKAMVRHIVTGPARCRARNEKVGGEKNSRHTFGDALDGIFEQFDDAARKWVQIPNAVVAAMARESGLFGGVGLKRYQEKGQNLVHLDTRPGWPAATW